MGNTPLITSLLCPWLNPAFMALNDQFPHELQGICMTLLTQFWSVLQRKAFSRAFSGYFQSISRIFPEHFQSIPRVFSEYFQGMFRVFPEYSQGIFRVFSGGWIKGFPALVWQQLSWVCAAGLAVTDTMNWAHNRTCTFFQETKAGV